MSPQCQFDVLSESVDKKRVWQCSACGFVTIPVRGTPHRSGCSGTLGDGNLAIAIAYLTCPHRGRVLATVSAQTAGCGCASSTVEFHQCRYFDEPVLKQCANWAANGNREKLSAASPGYKGRTCRECKVPFELAVDSPIDTLESLPIPDAGLNQNLANGIVTGAAAVHWPCLGSLAIAAYQQGLGLAVADHSLFATQRGELSRVGVRWIEHDQPDLPTLQMKRRIASDLKAWWKPWICLASPFDVSVWVDSDAVVVGDLAGLLELARESPCVSTQRLWQHDGERIYRELCEKIFAAEAGQGRLEAVANINSGVLAWRRGDPLLTRWQEWCVRLMSDDDLIVHCRVRDQAGLVVSMVDRQIRGEALPTLLPDEYNVPADYLPAKSSMNRKRVRLSPERLLTQTTERHSGAVIVHWLGGIKPWKIKQP